MKGTHLHRAAWHLRAKNCLFHRTRPPFGSAFFGGFVWRTTGAPKADLTRSTKSAHRMGSAKVPCRHFPLWGARCRASPHRGPPPHTGARVSCRITLRTFQRSTTISMRVSPRGALTELAYKGLGAFSCPKGPFSCQVETALVIMPNAGHRPPRTWPSARFGMAVGNKGDHLGEGVAAGRSTCMPSSPSLRHIMAFTPWATLSRLV